MIWLHEHLHGSGIVTEIVKMITMLGDKGLIWLAAGALMLCFKKTRKPAIVMILSLALTFIIGELIIKDIVARPRPISESSTLLNWLKSTGLKVPTDFSFPSGHSSSSMACVFVLIYFYGKRAIPAAIVGGGIMLSRIYLCVHYPTDVLGGILLGLLIARIVTLLYEKYYPQLKLWWAHLKFKRSLNKKVAK